MLSSKSWSTAMETGHVPTVGNCQTAENGSQPLYRHRGTPLLIRCVRLMRGEEGTTHERKQREMPGNLCSGTGVGNFYCCCISGGYTDVSGGFPVDCLWNRMLEKEVSGNEGRSLESAEIAARFAAEYFRHQGINRQKPS